MLHLPRLHIQRATTTLLPATMQTMQRVINLAFQVVFIFFMSFGCVTIKKLHFVHASRPDDVAASLAGNGRSFRLHVRYDLVWQLSRPGAKTVRSGTPCARVRSASCGLAHGAYEQALAAQSSQVITEVVWLRSSRMPSRRTSHAGTVSGYFVSFGYGISLFFDPKYE